MRPKFVGRFQSVTDRNVKDSQIVRTARAKNKRAARRADRRAARQECR